MSHMMMLATYRMEKQVALLLAAILMVVAVWPLFSGGMLVWPWLAAALLLLLLAWWRPAWLTPLANGWSRLGHWLGTLNSYIILALLFFLVITPVALLFRWRGRDALHLRQKKLHSYWQTEARQWSPESFKDQF